MAGGQQQEADLGAVGQRALGAARWHPLQGWQGRARPGRHGPGEDGGAAKWWRARRKLRAAGSQGGAAAAPPLLGRGQASWWGWMGAGPSALLQLWKAWSHRCQLPHGQQGNPGRFLVGRSLPFQGAREGGDQGWQGRSPVCLDVRNLPMSPRQRSEAVLQVVPTAQGPRIKATQAGPCGGRGRGRAGTHGLGQRRRRGLGHGGPAGEGSGGQAAGGHAPALGGHLPSGGPQGGGAGWGLSTKASTRTHR
jgi:hypothetical protein